MQNFTYYINVILDNLEGGYFHPEMYAKDPGRFAGRGENYNATIDKAYKNSGETMLGFDRKNGGELNTRAAMVKFWQLIDEYYSEHHGDLTWWGEKDGKFRSGKASPVPAAVGRKLREYAVETMLDEYNRLAGLFLSQKSRKIIEKDPGLLLQFLYACWNGSGRFQAFAKVVNDAISAGTTDPGTLQQLVQAKRVSIYGSANTVQSVTVPRLVEEVSAHRRGFPLWLLPLGLAAIFLYLKNKKS